ncbi:unnamed protein product [Lepeophtheirus salmonis]|uniref:(salmon louse) hypothetical protein n=1 Tax=Lepeophtheirus salmonis TaxID=72036 RepID=A0A7R8CRK2_LEPSM|nr:unnamed protein product [Lepeophtheirus salmonis]CAF2906479.1 unnamed protein product [Lepeophtheirus salmonis]
MVCYSETQELVKWIKRDPSIMASIPRNVATMKGKLNYVRNSEKGQKFLRETIRRLRETPHHKKSWEHYLVMSGFYSATKEFQKAYEAVSEAVRLLQIDANVIESLDLNEFLNYARKLSEDEKRFEVEIEPERIEVREIHELNTKDFHKYYCQRRIPVVINGYSGPKWTEQTLINQIGSKTVLLKRTEDYSDEWACLVPSHNVTVKEFIESGSDKEYLFDWSIPLHCPDNELVFQVPPYLS